MKSTKKTEGFTLIEIIFVLILLAVLSAFAVAKFQDTQEEAEIAVAKGMMTEANGGLRLLQQESLIENGLIIKPTLASLTTGTSLDNIIENGLENLANGFSVEDVGVVFTTSSGTMYCFEYDSSNTYAKFKDAVEGVGNCMAASEV